MLKLVVLSFRQKSGGGVFKINKKTLDNIEVVQSNLGDSLKDILVYHKRNISSNYYFDESTRYICVFFFTMI